MDKNQLVQLADNLHERLQSIILRKNLTQMQQDLSELESQSQSPDFWQNSDAAQETMQNIGGLQQEISRMNKLQSSITDAKNSLAEVTDTDQELIQLVEGELQKLEKELDNLELTTFLSGKFDKADAILSINAGTGGTEAMDWAEMLFRMYTRYCNSQGWKVSVMEKVDGPEAGISSVTLHIHGEYAYGYLKHEHGTHRLVRNSPFNSAGLRQTSFAGVDVSPLTNQEINIEIPDTDIEFQAVRSGGAGGQNVNKTSTAVRIRHIPSGILVASSVERGQLQNREAAMKILKAKLYLIEEERMRAEAKDNKGEYKQASWGNQIRNYVLQPYKLVKDTRTGVETAQSDAVLDGDLQMFIDAEIRML